jgi:hypothetical protein
MSSGKNRQRGEAYSGEGYGTLRYNLFRAARDHIESSIKAGYHCEAIAIIESVISDRLESRLSWLSKQNYGFKTLGWLIKKLRGYETDSELTMLLEDLDKWRERRNGAIHELVKVEAGKPHIGWCERMAELATSARDGYELLKRLYHRVADLNPKHLDRVFPRPEQV